MGSLGSIGHVLKLIADADLNPNQEMLRVHGSEGDVKRKNNQIVFKLLLKSLLCKIAFDDYYLYFFSFLSSINISSLL